MEGGGIGVSRMKAKPEVSSDCVSIIKRLLVSSTYNQRGKQ